MSGIMVQGLEEHIYTDISIYSTQGSKVAGATAVLGKSYIVIHKVKRQAL